MYPVIALIVLILFIWIILMWASCGEGDEHHDMERPEQRSDEQDHREVSLKQNVDRPTASPQLWQKRSCIMCEKTCRHAYVFRTPDGGSYDL